jgi:hypothetical protein
VAEKDDGNEKDLFVGLHFPPYVFEELNGNAYRGEGSTGDEVAGGQVDVYE